MLNILALILVLLFLAGSMWLYNRYAHKRRRQNELMDGDFEASSEAHEAHTPCEDCAGSGAKNRLGNIERCKVCLGTGVVSSASMDSLDN